MRALLLRLARRLGFRGAALLFFGQLDLVVAWSLVDPLSTQLVKAAPAYRVVLDVAPLQMWAAVWATVGVACIVQAWWRNDRVAFAAAISLKLVWGIALLAAWPMGAPRGWLAAEVWLTFAGFVAVIGAWPEPAQTGGTH